MARTVNEEFGKIISDLRTARYGFGVGRHKIGTEYAGQDKRGMILGLNKYGAAVGANLIMTLDKGSFATASKRLEAYKNIPWKKGDKAFENVADYMLGSQGPIERYFATESGPLGPWPEMSDLEERWRLMQGYPEGPLLYMTGDLYKAATDKEQMVQIQKTGQYARLVLSGEGIDDPTTRNEFFVHLLGSTQGWGQDITIPARPFMPLKVTDLNANEREGIQQAILKGITEGTMADRAFFGRG